jgi:hypothetical protein
VTTVDVQRRRLVNRLGRLCLFKASARSWQYGGQGFVESPLAGVGQSGHRLSGWRRSDAQRLCGFGAAVEDGLDESDDAKSGVAWIVLGVDAQPSCHTFDVHRELNRLTLGAQMASSQHADVDYGVEQAWRRHPVTAEQHSQALTVEGPADSCDGE